MLSVFEGPSVDRTLQNDESGASCKPPAGKTSVAFRQSQLGIRKGPLSRCADCKEARLFSGSSQTQTEADQHFGPPVGSTEKRYQDGIKLVLKSQVFVLQLLSIFRGQASIELFRMRLANMMNELGPPRSASRREALRGGPGSEGPSGPPGGDV
ncbi:hypothetical protein PCASD_20294 [Puccinia coronata f. sp. avenae]|uniref:Uncharacterized protein n=1 Tax=Puccinia coronata f. sp. avenae TaxID=200324 RepID=A0A2N5SPQ3_9BASI|nr:hypothetical protein PCASD_20294 [Puccinia coronata f. sp. avenae]